MEIWVDGERIKAVYTGCSTTSREWSKRGYKKYDKMESWMLPMLDVVDDPVKYVEFVGKDGKTYKIRADVVELIGVAALEVKAKAWWKFW